MAAQAAAILRSKRKRSVKTLFKTVNCKRLVTCTIYHLIMNRKLSRQMETP